MVRTYLLHASELDDNVLFQKYYLRLSEERQKKTDAFYFRKDKNLCVGAGILLDFGLTQLGFCQKNVQMALKDNGKPYLPQHPDVHFNISHSEEYVAAVFSDQEVGIDIEKITPIDLQIAQKYFFNTEYAAIKRQSSDEMRNDCFFHFWTLKESFMKITGLGMSLPLDQFEIIDGNPIRVKQTVNDKQYFFREYELPHYKIAVCSETEVSQGTYLVTHLSK